MKNIHINSDDNYATPPELYNLLNSRFNFDFDPCPYNENEIANDGLKIEWGKINWVNPPYSQKLKEAFIKKGIEESKKGKVCVFLIPVSTSTKLFHEWIKPNATEINFLYGRVKFGKYDEKGNFYLPLNKQGKNQSGTKDSMIVVFGTVTNHHLKYKQALNEIENAMERWHHARDEDGETLQKINDILFSIGKLSWFNEDNKLVIKEHIESITCPECKQTQDAKVRHNIPFQTYEYTCKCGYTIMAKE